MDFEINEQKINEVLKDALKIVVPSKAEKIAVLEFAEKVLSVAKEVASSYNTKAELVGSLARDTWLPNKKEIDIFIKFKKDIKKEILEERGLQIGKEIAEKLNAEYVIEFAEHPYVRIKFKDYQADIVPCYEIEFGEKIISAVDRSPLHNLYLKGKIEKLSDQVRLLKQFLLANGMYGADAKTFGFSGYLCELLILEYGTFLNLLKNAINWKPGEIIDIEKYYSEDEKKFLINKFRDQVLIVIDPVDKERNVAAALSAYNFFKFKKLAYLFLKDPSINFFIKKEYEKVKKEEIISYQLKRKTELILLVFNRPNKVDDIVYPQLRKFAKRIENILLQYNFKVLKSDVYANNEKCFVIFEMEIFNLPKVEIKIGPPIFDLENCKNFIEKYKNVSVFENRLIAEVKRKFERAIDKIKDSLSKEEKILLAKGIPSYIAKEISNGFDITNETEKIYSYVEKYEDFGKFLKKFFTFENLFVQ